MEGSGRDKRSPPEGDSAPGDGSSRRRISRSPDELQHVDTSRADLQQLLSHPRMPRYLASLYAELDARQRGGTSWTWNTAALIEQYQGTILGYQTTTAAHQSILTNIKLLPQQIQALIPIANEFMRVMNRVHTERTDILASWTAMGHEVEDEDAPLMQRETIRWVNNSAQLSKLAALGRTEEHARLHVSVSFLCCRALDFHQIAHMQLTGDPKIMPDANLRPGGSAFGQDAADIREEMQRTRGPRPGIATVSDAFKHLQEPGPDRTESSE
ncbi:hypothetical protein WJX73_007445 [Symbiochloris irregularis]|uniref:Uncharacterized protein n=1 Tax=Symbiochloris irregularis TaxID=706552 RepID=A0AAW1NNH5_9CHLO